MPKKKNIPTPANYDDSVLDMLEQAEELKFEGNHQEAIKLLENLLFHEPGCIEAFEEIGDNYLSLRELEKAQKALAHALQLNPESYNGYYLLGFLHSLRENWKGSVECLKKADELAPNHPEILRCLGWAFYNTNRKSQGISVLERSLNLNPFDPNILCDLGVCYLNAGGVDKAELCFRKAEQIEPESEQVQECLKMVEDYRKMEQKELKKRVRK